MCITVSLRHQVSQWHMDVVKEIRNINGKLADINSKYLRNER
ncbi:hypothetical protein [Echinicola sp. 20G]|nr:hypothetical protein [Echinicola sp. 20G]